MKRKIKTTCYIQIVKRFEQKYCPFSHCDFEGNPANERRYFCLIWSSLLKQSNDGHLQGLGYLASAQIIGQKRCGLEEFALCPLLKCLVSNR